MSARCAVTHKASSCPQLRQHSGSVVVAQPNRKSPSPLPPCTPAPPSPPLPRTIVGARLLAVQLGAGEAPHLGQEGGVVHLRSAPGPAEEESGAKLWDQSCAGCEQGRHDRWPWHTGLARPPALHSPTRGARPSSRCGRSALQAGSRDNLWSVGCWVSIPWGRFGCC